MTGVLPAAARRPGARRHRHRLPWSLRALLAGNVALDGLLLATALLALGALALLSGLAGTD